MVYVPPTPDYTEPRGTGDRRVDILVTPTPAFSLGIPSNLVDGSVADNTGGSALFTGSLSTMDIEFDFGPRSSVLITEITWKQSTAAAHGTWQWQGWNGSGWDDIGSTFTLGGSTTQVITTMSGATTPYRIYRLHHTGAGGNTSAAPWLEEIEFKISEQNDVATHSENSGGKGDRTGFMVATTDAALGGTSGAISRLIDGVLSGDAAGGIWFSGGQSGKKVVIDFNIKVILDKLLWLQATASSQGSWRLAGSDDGVTEDEVLLQIAGDAGSDDFNLGTAIETRIQFLDTASGNPNPGYRYYILTQVSGTTTTPWITELQFAVTPPPPAPPSGGSRIPVLCVICS